MYGIILKVSDKRLLASWPEVFNADVISTMNDVTIRNSTTLVWPSSISTFFINISRTPGLIRKKIWKNETNKDCKDFGIKFCLNSKLSTKTEI